jgi:hypothetical protein
MFSRNWGLARGVAIAALALAMSACSSNLAAPTQPPGATPTPEATETATDTPSPEITLTPTPPATASPSSAATPVATPTPLPLPSPSGSAAPTASSPASACTGTADHQAFFAEASSKLIFDVYCAVLPSGWFLQSAAYELPNGGKLTISYKGPGGATLSISEGAFCTTSAADCSPHVSIRGTAAFGDRPGMLDVLSTPPDVLVVYVDPGTTRAYSISANNLTQAKFVAIAAALSKVPKS